MKLTAVFLLILSSFLMLQCGVSSDISSNETSSNSNESSTTSSTNTDNSGKEWYYISSSVGHIGFYEDKGYGEVIGAETDYTKVKNLTLLLDIDQKTLPSNLTKLVNLERIKVERMRKNKTGQPIENQIKMDVSSLLNFKKINSINLINLEPLFGQKAAPQSLEELWISSCNLTEMPNFIANSSLKYIYMTYSKVAPFKIGKLPNTLTDFKYNNVTDSQEIEIVGQVGLDNIFGTFSTNVPDRFSFESSENTPEQLLAKKDQVMRLFITLESNSDDYFSIINSLPNLQHLYITETQGIEESKVYKSHDFPSEVFNCTKLTLLKIRSERIEFINEDLSVLTNLREIRLEGPFTKIIPFKIEGLERLEIDLGFSMTIESFSPSIATMYNNDSQAIEKLSAHQANLDQIFKNHPNLRELLIKGNSHFGLTNSFSFESLNGCTKLKYLELNNLKTTTFPKFIFNNPNMGMMRLYCTMSDFPEDFSKLPNLHTLAISTNATKIPDGLFQIKNLKTLEIKGYKLVDFNKLFEPNIFPNLNRLILDYSKADIELFRTYKKNNPDISVKFNLKEL